MIQHFRSSLFLTACALALISPLAAQDLSLEMDPAQSKVEFTLGDVLHTVRGSFQFKRGAIRFDLGSGKASGELLVDARSGASGNDTRDRKMHKEILESRSEEHTSELQSLRHLVCRLLLEKKQQ